MTISDPKTCFAITPIGSPGTETRKKADQVFKHIISKAVGPLGYKAVRADQIHEPGIITSQVIREIVNAPLAIADLSEKNPNVFYEVAVRHVTRKPLIMLITRGEPIPFDVSANRVIQYDLSDLDTVESAKEEIKRQVESLASGSPAPENPISAAVEIQLLKQSGKPEQESLADIKEAISEIRTQVSSLSQSNARRVSDATRREITQRIRAEETEMRFHLNGLVQRSMALSERIKQIDQTIGTANRRSSRSGETQDLRAERNQAELELREIYEEIDRVRRRLSSMGMET